MSDSVSFSVLTADIISLLLLSTLYLSNRQKMGHGKDMQYILQMIGITAISNVADCGVYYIDGNVNLFAEIVMFLSGTWLFLGNVLIGYTWAKFLMAHMNIPFSDKRKKVYHAIGLVACILLIINIFYPLVFTQEDGIYQRGPAYSIFLIFAVFYIADSLLLYGRRVKKINTFKLFPVRSFLMPIIAGIAIQAVFIEIALTWTSIAIAIAGVMTALKDETIFLDYLTGLYNRAYLEFLQRQACKKKSTWISGIMIDLNSFKQINDNYGHSEGDRVLVTVANLLEKSFSEYGVVTRYAGDEFVVILNTTDETLIKKIIADVKNNFEEENKKSNRPYQLSASMGYGIVDLSNETIDDFMNRIDNEMYQDKLAYYKMNDRRQK